MFNNIERVVKKFVAGLMNNIALVVTICFAIVTLVLWFYSTENHDFSDLWLNLSSGFIASILTIAVIEYILKKQKAKSEEPLRLALYRDVQLFASRLISLWQEMYVQSNEKRDNISVKELFSEKNISAIYDSLDLEGEPNVIPKQNWFTYISNNSEDLIKRGNRILDRYPGFAEPELFQSIHHLVNDSPFVGALTMMNKLRLHDISDKFPRHPLLRCYTIEPNDRDYSSINSLFKWCREEYLKLEKVGCVYKIADKVVIINSNTPPNSVMTEQKMLEISIAYEKFVEGK